MLRTKLKITKKLNSFKSKKIGDSTSKMAGKQYLSVAIMKFLLKFLVIFIFGLIVLFPFYYMLTGSLMTYDEITGADQKTHLWPEMLKWSNFTAAFQEGYWNAIVLTAIVTFISIVFKIIVTMMLGYAFSLPKWKGKKIAWYFLLSTLALPEVALMSGQLTVITKLGWRLGIYIIISLVIPFAASVFSSLMFKNAFESIPVRTKEAAMVDGVSNFKYFIKIAMPMVSPTTWTVGILTAFAAWNSFMWPSILLKTSNAQVMSTWLFKTGLSKDPGQSRLLIQVRLAAAVLAILPMFIAYFIMRIKIMRAISRQGSAIKG